jgi:DnaK suppressor protein
MIRKDALKRVTKLLTQRRIELRKRLGMDMGDMGQRAGGGDVADIAFSSIGDELSSRLAELEGRELVQIELALQRIKQGRYGICDVCDKRILVGRLNAVPYSIMCIRCQNEAERNSDWLETHAGIDWERVHDGGEDREVDLAALEYDARK